MNFVSFTSTISWYTESLAKTRDIIKTIATTYEIIIAIFVLVDICDLYVVNRVIRKNGAANAFVKNVRM